MTLSRLADYFAGLAAGGDESNAIIDAADAVNLMTVHAAKGLEFPVVFVVNIGKGSGGGRDDIRVAVAPFVDDEALDDAGEAAVSIGAFENDRDREADDREHEETKRLLYVALTRARDRLYLAGTTTEGKLILQRGSIGRILPATLPDAMVADSSDDFVSWQGVSATHLLRRVRFSLP